MNFLETRGASLYVESFLIDIASPWVVFINGHSRTSRDFRAFGRYLQGKNINAVAFDNRGCGQTKSDSFTIEDCTNDIVEILDFFSIDSAHILGISYGGVLAQSFAIAHLKRLKSLTLVSTTPESKYVKTQTSFANIAPDQIDKYFLNYFSDSFQKKNSLMIKALVKENVVNIQNPEHKEGALLQRKILENAHFTPDLKKITVPTLVLHGDQDKIISPEAAKVLNKNISESQLDLFENIGHLLLAECPQRLYDETYNFISAVENG